MEGSSSEEGLTEAFNIHREKIPKCLQVQNQNFSNISMMVAVGGLLICPNYRFLIARKLSGAWRSGVEPQVMLIAAALAVV